MQSIFQTYLELGFTHIADLAGYDHILFITALCAIYRLREWRKVLILVTAFTIGHSITLALAALEIIPINSKWVEFLIPITIFITAIYNVTMHRFPQGGEGGLFERKISINYLFGLLFGLIHGLGFSNFFRAMTMPGQKNRLLEQLLAFNLGVEIGQIVILTVVLGLGTVFMGYFSVKQREWNLFVSGGAASLALVMALERIPWP
jgi:hypothetical protein